MSESKVGWEFLHRVGRFAFFVSNKAEVSNEVSTEVSALFLTKLKSNIDSSRQSIKYIPPCKTVTIVLLTL